MNKPRQKLLEGKKEPRKCEVISKSASGQQYQPPVLLPVLDCGDVHPFPYFISEPLVLPRPSDADYNQSDQEPDDDLVHVRILDDEILGPAVEQMITIEIWDVLHDEAEAIDEQADGKLAIEERRLDATTEALLRRRVLEGHEWRRSSEEDNMINSISWDRLVVNYRNIISNKDA